MTMNPDLFFEASSHIYKRVCPLFGPSVHPLCFCLKGKSTFPSKKNVQGGILSSLDTYSHLSSANINLNQQFLANEPKKYLM